MSDTPTPPAKRRLDPLLLPLFAGGAVLVLALTWLLITPRPNAPPLANLGPLEARLAALEARPGFNAAPLETRITALEARPRATAAPDLAPLLARLEGLEKTLATVESRPAPSLDVSGLAPRALAETLATRLDRITERQDALAARLQAADAEALRRTEDLARALLARLDAAEAIVAAEVRRRLPWAVSRRVHRVELRGSPAGCGRGGRAGRVAGNQPRGVVPRRPVDRWRDRG